MKRGFKAEAKRKSLAIREELGVATNEALNCFELAEYMSIPSYPVDCLCEFGFSTQEIEVVCYANGNQQFSATTISVPSGYIIVYNQTHTMARTNSSLAHEISHILCGHDFSSLSHLKKVSREFNKDKEDEANWLAGCLLLPEDGLIWSLKRNMTIPEIADHFDISQQMARWRYNSTGMARRKQYFR